MTSSAFVLEHRDPASKARAGILQTPHGPVETPVFMPVGTQGTVKTMGAEDMDAMGCRILLGNTYHLFLRPGLETLERAGGLHKFMGYSGSILTDSGGYQVFSLAQRCTVSEDGAQFYSHVDGSKRFLSPEIATEFQLKIGADIAMCFDELPPYPSLKEDARKSLERTLRWAERCKKSYAAHLSALTPALSRKGRGSTTKEKNEKNEKTSSAGFMATSPAALPLPLRERAGVRGRLSNIPLLFGIVQGANFPDLRQESSQRTVDIGFPGYAIGGLGIGETKKEMWEFLEASVEPLPTEAPRYMMGIGQPEDMWDGVERGVDMFDCVLPTRNGRNGQGFTSRGRVNVTNGKFKEDFSPLDPDCSCVTCARYTRAYLCHLFRAGELLGPRLVTLHNLTFMLGLLRTIRTALINGHFREEKQRFLERYNAASPSV